ncbi:putative signal transducing protein [Sphingobacterium alimentarium]|jgi:hypothetical protein|uniref:Putative signal transducing protein n=1 Tax=Sphingobacterium alimentarium TaxID=797292 RepID=A0A4R3VZG9_9SPHI|nr:DUF2007 domain-containing protein [Sphingobacterium alimentarium]TCV12905.1 putative signal transducing protein [Sphingobacterium alimentarium]
MGNDWIKVRTFTQNIEAEIVKQMLEENGVNAVLLNKQDSSYLFGKIELYVKQSDETIANVLINSSTFTEEDDAN